VIVSPEAGLVTVRATARQHQEIQSFLDQLLSSTRRQVLIEATIAEVQLTDDFQLGVDWARISDRLDRNGLSILTGLLNPNNSVSPPGTGLPSPGIPSTFTIQYRELGKGGNVSVLVQLLREFGNVRVLSSPKIMALNNQTAVLKVVDDLVYFTVNVETIPGTGTNQTIQTFETVVHSLPVGVVMTVTPQISQSDSVILNVRPTISRQIGSVQDPNPDLADAGVVSQVPVIRTREIESVLQVRSGDVAVLGGLMQDQVTDDTRQLPFLGDIPGLGDAFKFRSQLVTKTELIIFLRPVVVEQASLDADLAAYRPLLEQVTTAAGGGLPPPAAVATGGILP
jgi:general secretion pathway protein D